MRPSPNFCPRVRHRAGFGHVDNLVRSDIYITAQQRFAGARNGMFLITFVQCVPEEIVPTLSMNPSAAAFKQRAGDCCWRWCTKVHQSAMKSSSIPSTRSNIDLREGGFPLRRPAETK